MLPQADPAEPVYQNIVPGIYGFGGLYKKVRIPTTEDIKKRLKFEFALKMQEERLKQIRVANRMILWGFIAAIIFAVAHGVNSVEFVKNLLSYGIGAGIISVVGGIGYKWFQANEVALGWIFGISVFVGLSLWVLSHEKVRDWSVSCWIKNPTGKKKRCYPRSRVTPL